jgi:hypothetical protein
LETRCSKPKPESWFKGINPWVEIIRLIVALYVRFSLSLWNVDYPMFGRDLECRYVRDAAPVNMLTEKAGAC